MLLMGNLYKLLVLLNQPLFFNLDLLLLSLLLPLL